MWVGLFCNFFMAVLTSLKWNREWICDFFAYKVTLVALFTGLLANVLLSILKNKVKWIQLKSLSYIAGIILLIIINSVVEFSPLLNAVMTNGYMTEVWIAPSWEASHAAILGGLVSIFIIILGLSLDLDLRSMIKLGNLTILTILLSTFSSTFFVGWFLVNKEALKLWWLVSSLICGTTFCLNFYFFKKLKYMQAETRYKCTP